MRWGGRRPRCIQRQAYELTSCGVSRVCPRLSMLICGQDLWTRRRQGSAVMDSSEVSTDSGEFAAAADAETRVGV